MNYVTAILDSAPIWPGMIVGRLSVEPWLILFGVACGWLRPWISVAAGFLLGLSWGLLVYVMSGEPYIDPPRFVGLLWLPALIVAAFAGLTVLVRTLLFKKRVQSAN